MEKLIVNPSELLSKEKSIKHYVSTNKIKSLDDFLNQINYSDKININNIVISKQVHGNKILVLDKPVPKNPVNGYDGLITNLPNLTLIIKSADCCPILIYDKKEKVIAAVHAGRAGTELKVVQKAVRIIQNNFHSIPENTIAYLGPCICHDCYQIDREKDIHFDLKSQNKQQLIEMGIPEKNIEVSEFCTFCNSNHLFYSYRKDKTESRTYSGIAITN